MHSNVNDISNRSSSWVGGFVFCRPEGSLVVSTYSFPDAIGGQTSMKGKEEGKTGCPGTDPRLSRLHTDGFENPQGVG